MKKLTKESRCLLFTSAFLFLIFTVLLIVSLVCKMYGLVVGWSIGCMITLVSMFLLFKSGELIAKSATGTGKGGALVVIFYISRFGLYAAGLILCAVLDYKLKLPQFKFSLFTCLCALLPSHLFIAILYHDNDEPVTKSIENKEEVKK